MVFIFWQGIISIHQQAFLEALAVQPGIARVILVVERSISAYRQSMGWETPEMKGIEVIVAPTRGQIAEIVGTDEAAIHLFGGLRAGKMMRSASDLCFRMGRRVGVMTEPFDAAGIKGFLRNLKYRYYRLAYGKNVQFVLAIGRQGVAQFTAQGYGHRVFPWAYFMDVPESPLPKRTDRVYKMIYAGRLEESKGIYRFLTELLAARNGAQVAIDLYGEGSDEPKIRELVQAHGAESFIRISPFVPHDELLKRLPDYEYVVLPSTQKDGWGVIISEGLLMGLKALCSSICGVSWVVTDGQNGVVFDWRVPGSCREAIGALLSGKVFAAPEVIKENAQATISGIAGARYFLAIIDHVYHDAERPDMPWAGVVWPKTEP